MGFPTLVLASLLVASLAVSANEGPCTAEPGACTERVTLGGGPAGSLIYRSYPLDVHNERITPVLAMVLRAICSRR